MVQTDSPAQYHPTFWLKPALVLPLAIGGLCLVGVSLVAEVLLVLVLDPFLADISWGWRALCSAIARTVWLISIPVIAIVAARLVIRRIEGEASGIHSDRSLDDAMTSDHSVYLWWLLALMVTGLGISAASVLLGVSSSELLWSIFWVFLGSGLTLRFVGLAVKQAHPELWPQIQARAARKAGRPSRKMLALLLSTAAFAVIVGNLPTILEIWSNLH